MAPTPGTSVRQEHIRRKSSGVGEEMLTGVSNVYVQRHPLHTSRVSSSRAGKVRERGRGDDKRGGDRTSDVDSGTKWASERSSPA